MPTVSLYGGQKVSTEALPGVRKTAAENDVSTGAVLDEAKARTDEAIAGLGGAAVGVADQGLREIARVQKQEKDRADQIAVFDANNQLLQWKNQRLYDPKDGALTVKGQAAMPLPEEVGDEFKDYADQVGQTMTTPKQKEAFAKLQLDHQTDLDLTLRRHVYSEMQTYEGNVLQATVSNNTDDAIRNANDPRRVGSALGNIVTAIQASGPRLGLPPEMVTEQVAAARSTVFTGVIGQLIDGGQQKAAQAYYDEVKQDLKAPAIEHIERALSEGRVKKDSQTQADAIIAAGGSLTDQRAKAKQIDDPAVRDAVEQRLEHENALNEAATREAQQAKLKGVYDTLDQTKDVNQIPPTTWASMTGGERSAAMDYATKLAKGEPVATDVPTYYSLMKKAGDDPNTFATTNLLAYKSVLSKEDFDHFAGIQLAIKNGDRAKAEKDLGPARLQEGVVDDGLTLYGIDPKSKPNSPEGRAIAQLREMLRTRVEAQQNLTGKPVPDTDVQKMLDGILSTSKDVPGSWWGVFPGAGPFFNSSKRAIDLTIEDIPATDKAQITDALKRAGRPVSDATVLGLYIDAQARKPK